MAIPQQAILWAESMDPYDVLDFAVDCSNLLDFEETISSFSVVPGPESGLLGLAVNNPDNQDEFIRFWLSVIPANASDAAFSGAGSVLPVEVSFSTSSGRKWQRTIAVRVTQR